MHVLVILFYCASEFYVFHSINNKIMLLLQVDVVVARHYLRKLDSVHDKRCKNNTTKKIKILTAARVLFMLLADSRTLLEPHLGCQAILQVNTWIDTQTTPASLFESDRRRRFQNFLGGWLWRRL
jgi:hypothetical protein